MSYIIVFRNSHREPFIHTDSHGFRELYSTFEQAEVDAKEILDPKDGHYLDYQIYQEVDS